MRKLIVVGCLLLGGLFAWACVPAGQSVFLVSAQALDSSCQVDFATELTFGTLNTALTSDYIVGFSIESTLARDQNTAGGQVVDSPSSNDFIGQEAVLSYRSIANGVRSQVPGLVDQRQPILAVIAPGANRDNSYIAMNLFTSATASAVAALPHRTDLIVSVRIEGRLRGGAALSTNTLEFPVRILNVAPTCPAGQRTSIRAGTCGNPGQDTGSGFQCVTLSADGGVVGPPSGF